MKENALIFKMLLVRTLFVENCSLQPRCSKDSSIEKKVHQKLKFQNCDSELKNWWRYTSQEYKKQVNMIFLRLSIFRVEFRRFIRSDSGSGAEFARFLKLLVSYICTYIATECQNRSENLINRKLSIFYIETMYQLFFQLQPKNIFFGDQKYFSKKKTVKNIFR